MKTHIKMFILVPIMTEKRDSAVGIAIGYGVDD
jgi:hypothetical protein